MVEVKMIIYFGNLTWIFPDFHQRYLSNVIKGHNLLEKTQERLKAIAADDKQMEICASCQMREEILKNQQEHDG